jgi:hypothetical protein
MDDQPTNSADDGTAPAWRITERSVEVAQSRADMWLTFAGRALQRARKGGPLRWGLVTECWSFVVAVDHVRNCAVMATKAATVHGVSNDIATALAAFDQVAPDLAALRNVLEHHDDDYVLGTGNLQQPGRPRRDRVVDEALACGWGIRCGYTDPFDAEHPWISVGPSESDPAGSSHHLRVELAETYQAAQQLRMALYLAAAKQGLNVTNRRTSPDNSTR